MNNTITRIQLIPTAPSFISGYLDVEQRVPVPINYAISDIRDPQKRTGSFSKTITLPGTKNNNKLLSQLFEVNIADGLFSVKRLYRCLLLQDNIPLHETELSLQLISVNKVQNQLTEDDIIEYEVVVRDDVAQFFSEVANRKLTDIDLTDLNHNVNQLTIISSFTNTWVNGYKYLLPFKDNTFLFDFFEAIPSVYAKTYWDRIHADAGFTYEFFNNIEPQYFNRLIIPSNRSTDDQVQLTQEANKVIVNLAGTQVLTMPAVVSGLGGYAIGQYPPDPAVPSSFSTFINYTQIIQDAAASFVLPNSWSPQLNTTNNFRVTINFDYIYTINNPNAFPITIFTQASQGNVFSMDVYHSLFISAGPGVGSFIGAGFPQTSLIQQDVVGVVYPIGISQGAQNVQQTYSDSVILPSTSIGQTLNSYLDLLTNTSLISADFFELRLEITNVSLVIELEANQTLLNQIIDMNATIPDLTQAEFLKSIYTMYNLYVVPDKLISNKLVYYIRDDYYRNGKTIDWTSKMARDSEQKIQFLPELRNKELILTYKEDKDVANEFYTNATREVYGQKSILFDIEWTKGTDKKEISFGPTPTGLNNFGLYLPYISRETNPRILLDNGIRFTNVGIIYNYDVQGNPLFTAINYYPFASHLNAPINPTFDLNFGDNPYFFYDISVPTLNNLYNQFWRNTIQLIDEGKLLTAYFYLTPKDIYELELNDVVRIDNSYWNINKVIDYDAGADNLTKVELITNSELLPFPIVGGNEEPEEE